VSIQSERVRRARSRRRAPAFIAVAGAGLAIFVAAIGASGSSASDGPTATAAAGQFKILAVMPMSGALATVGQTEKAGFDAAIKNINANGGINGQKVTLKVVDDAGTGAKAVSGALQALRGSSYNMVSCGSFGDDGLACAPAIAKFKVLQMPLIAESSLSNVKKYPYLFQPGYLFDPAEAALVGHLKSKRVKRIAIMAGDNATGKVASGILAREARRAGIKVTAQVLVPVTTADATPQVQKVKASKPQAIAITGFTPANGPIIKARTKLGWNVPVYGDKYFGAANLALFATSRELRGITVQADPWSVKGNGATGSHNFKVAYAGFKAFQSKFVLNVIANLVSYNAVMLTRYAARKAHSTDGVKMARALSRTGTSSGISGFIGPRTLYTQTRHSWMPAAREFAYVKAGPTINGLIVPGR
jgi:branched-chain amino acid transport system substrate-binding protein